MKGKDHCTVCEIHIMIVANISFLHFLVECPVLLKIKVCSFRSKHRPSRRTKNFVLLPAEK